jgi:hypothetical protein
MSPHNYMTYFLHTFITKNVILLYQIVTSFFHKQFHTIILRHINILNNTKHELANKNLYLPIV